MNFEGVWYDTRGGRYVIPASDPAGWTITCPNKKVLLCRAVTWNPEDGGQVTRLLDNHGGYARHEAPVPMDKIARVVAIEPELASVNVAAGQEYVFRQTQSPHGMELVKAGTMPVALSREDPLL
eukprot:PhM_4_TR969/c0_g1_i1/m.43273